MSRCSEAERQLAQSRDLEGGLGFGGDDEEGDGYDEGGAVGNNGGENYMICFFYECVFKTGYFAHKPCIRVLL